MHISKIQTQIIKQPNVIKQTKINNNNNTVRTNKIKNPAFKGSDKGLITGTIIGTCIGLCTALLVASTGVLIIPSILALGISIGGGYAGEKIEDILNEKKKNSKKTD